MAIAKSPHKYLFQHAPESVINPGKKFDMLEVF